MQAKIGLVKTRLTAAALMALSCIATQAMAADTSADELKAWRKVIAQTPVPVPNACYTASYPDTTWTEIQCVIDPNPQPFGRIPLALGGQSSERTPGSPSRQMRNDATGIQNVGGGGTNDYMVRGSGLPSTSVTRSEGTFTTVSGITSESDGLHNNEYSVQLNTNTFPTSLCTGTYCVGWEQFVYLSSTSGYATLEFWLESKSGACPSSAWTTIPAGFVVDCFMDGPHVTVPQLSASSLNTLDIVANSGAGALYGSMTLTIGGTAYYTYDPGIDTLGLTNSWSESEFNVFGDPGHPKASFNTGSSLTVYASIGVMNSTNYCVGQSETSETNNLTLQTCAAAHPMGEFPYITFTESK